MTCCFVKPPIHMLIGNHNCIEVVKYSCWDVKKSSPNVPRGMAVIGNRDSLLPSSHLFTVAKHLPLFLSRITTPRTLPSSPRQIALASQTAIWTPTPLKHPQPTAAPPTTVCMWALLMPSPAAAAAAAAVAARNPWLPADEYLGHASSPHYHTVALSQIISPRRTRPCCSY
jgi:hypothetical protein